MKIEDNHYTYRIETKDSNGGSLDFIDIDTVEPLRCAYDVQDELNLETNEHIKRVEEIVLNANSTEFWYVDEARTSDTHLVCYFEEVKLMASKDHAMVDTNRSVFEYGKINSNEHQNTNFICTHVMDNGVSRIYMSIDKETFGFATFNNETIKHFISNNPVTVWYALRYEVIIPRSMSKGHLLTLSGQTDITLTTTSEQAKLPIMKFNIGDTQYTLDNNPIHINNTQEGTQIRNIVLEGNTPINYARGNGVNTTEQVSNTRYDFDPFYDGQATIQGTVEGGYVSAKLYGDTMVNIAKPYGETPLLTATNNVSLCDDLLGTNEEGIVLTDGEITEGRIVGDSLVNIMADTSTNKPIEQANHIGDVTIGGIECWHLSGNNTQVLNLVQNIKPSTTYTIKVLTGASTESITLWDMHSYNGNSYTKIVTGVHLGIPRDRTLKEIILTITTPSDAVKITLDSSGGAYFAKGKFIMLEGEYTEQEMKAIPYFNGIGSVVNPCTTFLNNNFTDKNLFNKDTVTVNYVLNTSTGEPSKANSGYSTSDFIFVAKGYNYRVANDNCSEMCFYDLNKNFISSISRSFTPTQNGYIRFVYDNDNINRVMFGSFSSTNPTYTEYQQLDMQQATFPYTLNKLPNGVADYIDVVNKVHVQRVGRVVLDGTTNDIVKEWYNDTWSWASDIAQFECSIDNLKGYADNSTLSVLSDKLPSVTWVDSFKNGASGVSRNEGILAYVNSRILILLSTNKIAKSSTLQEKLDYLESNPITVLYELATPIYTPLTEEEIAQLPLSAYADGYVNLSSDQLMPSFEFRMRASNRYQVDMLETGYYYLNAPVGNVKLGTTSVDVSAMPCIIKVDNVGTGDSGYRLSTSNGYYKEVELTIDGYYVNINNGELLERGDRATSDYIYIDYYDNICFEHLGNREYFDMVFYDENKKWISFVSWDMVKNYGKIKAPKNAKYFRFSIIHKGNKIIKMFSPITLAKLPSHRIPTSFTQGMKCGTDFGYWEGIKESAWRGIRLTGESGDGSLRSKDNTIRYLNRLEGNYQGNVIIEDEFDFGTGKLTKRVGKVVLDGSIFIYDTRSIGEEYTYMTIFGDRIGVNFKNGFGNYGFAMSDIVPFGVNYSGEYNHMFTGGNNLIIIIKNSELGVPTKEGIVKYFEANPMTVYYELAVPEISYIDVLSHEGKTVNNETKFNTNYYIANTYLQPQYKPSHLTYPVPSLVGNRTYTVVHNRKNISGSTKSIELNLGGTVVQLNDASSKTLVKTPSTLAHSNLIFIGGESTVDHIMVLDGDWTNKPIEYFENMKGHDTDAIITIIGDGKIDDVPEQYLW